MFPSIRLLLLSCALAHNLVFAFDWLAPFKAPRSTARKSLVHPSPLVAPAQTRVPKVYGLPGDVAKVRASTVRGRSSLLRSSATIEKTKRGSQRPVKRIVVVIPPKEGSTPKAALAPPSKVTPKQAAALPDAKLYEHEYWFDPRIHNWGNVGWGGLVHAIFAPLATYAIDKLSYGGVDVRRKVHEMIPADASVLDLCCGTGFSSARGATAIDTSREMITVAKLRRPDCKFETGNAETYGETNSYDVVTMMFATHEMPAFGRRRVLRNAMRLAKKSVIIADIDPDFHETLRAKPMEGATFLSGEPYVLDYLKRMDGDVQSCAPMRLGGPTWKVTREAIVPKHVVVWRLDRVD